jgi:hypothetical protein
LLERGGMHDVVDTVQCTHQPVLVANVTEEKPQTRVVIESQPNFVLLELITRKNNDLLRVEVRECVLNEGLTE